MADDAQLRAICATHDIHYMRLASGLALVREKMEGDDAELATGLILSAISPAYAARLNHAAAEEEARLEAERAAKEEAEAAAKAKKKGKGAEDESPPAEEPAAE